MRAAVQSSTHSTLRSQSCTAGARTNKPLSPAPSPQGIREDAGPGWPRPAEAAEPGGVDTTRIESRQDENGLRERRPCSSVETQPHERPAVPGVLGLHRAAMRLGHLADDREPEAGAGHRARRGRAVEAIEDEGTVLVGESRPVVPHLQLAAGERDLDRAPVAAPLAGVLEQVPDGALHPVAITVDDGRLQSVGLPRDFREARARSLDGVLHDLVELELLLLDRRAGLG